MASKQMYVYFYKLLERKQFLNFSFKNGEL